MNPEVHVRFCENRRGSSAGLLDQVISPNSEPSPENSGLPPSRTIFDINHATYYDTSHYYIVLMYLYRKISKESFQTFANIAKITHRKLRQLEIANRLDDLRIPPGNHLEAVKGDHSGQYSIRINKQWRVCFYWTSTGAEEVEFVDYH